MYLGLETPEFNRASRSQMVRLRRMPYGTRRPPAAAALRHGTVPGNSLRSQGPSLNHELDIRVQEM